MAIQANAVKPLKNTILAENIEQGSRVTKGGIILQDDNMKDSGIRPRWCRVYAIGPEVDEQLKPGNWILVEHGRWTRGITVETPDGTIYLQKIDPNGILLVCDEDPRDKAWQP